MSAVPLTWANAVVPSYIIADPIYQNQATNVSTIVSNHIVLDGVNLDCSTAGGGTLLVNGVAVASVNQNVSSIANWAQFPALSSITYSGGGGTGGLVNMATGQFSTINNTSSIVAGSLGATSGLFSTLNTSSIGASVVTGGVISATTVNKLNLQTNAPGTTGTIVTLNQSSMTTVVTSTQPYSFVAGGTYLLEVPFATNYNSQTFLAGNTLGQIRYQASSATAFPAIFSGAHGQGYNIFATSVVSQSTGSIIYGHLSAVAVAQATVSEGIGLSAVCSAGLSTIICNTITAPSNGSLLSAVRLA